MKEPSLRTNIGGTNADISSTNAPFKSKLNFLNMTDASIEALSEPDLREGLIGRGVDVSEITDKVELIRKAKNL